MMIRNSSHCWTPYDVMENSFIFLVNTLDFPNLYLSNIFQDKIMHG